MSAGVVPDSFFTASSFATVSGCALFVWLLVNGLRTFFNVTAKWLFLAISALTVVAVFLSSGQPWQGLQVLILVGNIFVVAFAALGLQEGAARGVGAATPSSLETTRPRASWLSSWLA